MNFSKKILFSTVIFLITSCKSSNKKEIASHFYSFDKTKIAFTDEGNGEPILLIHGFIVNGTSWNKSVLKKNHC